jgi:hypothetical protein
MRTTSTYLERVLPALDRVAGRFTTLLDSLPDPAAPVPGSAWSVRDAAAHVATVVPRYADGPEGRGAWTEDPRGLAAINEEQLRALGTADLGELAARVRRDLVALVAQVRAYGEQPPTFRSHGGERVGPTPPSASCSASWSSTAGTSPAPPAGPGRSSPPTPS